MNLLILGTGNTGRKTQPAGKMVTDQRWRGTRGMWEGTKQNFPEWTFRRWITYLHWKDGRGKEKFKSLETTILWTYTVTLRNNSEVQQIHLNFLLFSLASRVIWVQLFWNDSVWRVALGWWVSMWTLVVVSILTAGERS